MIEKIEERVSVNLVYNRTTHTTTPKHIKWRSKVYTIEHVGLHYPIYKGKTLVHMFSVSDTQRCFLLAFNTQSLGWQLEEISDGNF